MSAPGRNAPVPETASPEACLRVGLGHLKAGRTAAALLPLRKALTLAPADPRVRYSLAAALLRAGEPGAALEGFDSLLAETCGHAGAAFGRGLALYALGRRSAALQAFRQITLADPLAWKAWGSIADITPDEADRIRAISAAAGALEQLCSGAGTSSDLIAAAADALLAARRPTRAASLLQRRCGPVSGGPIPDRRLARAFYHQGRFREAFGEACCLLANTDSPAFSASAPPVFATDTAVRVLMEILDILSSAGVTAFLAAGTLLGFHRKNGPLAHDRDIDIGVLRQPGGGPDIAAILRAHPRILLARIARPGDRYFPLQYKGVAADIFVHDTADGHLLCGFSDLAGDIQWRFSAFGLTCAKYGARRWTIPENPRRYLAETYGPGWQVPDTGFASAVSSPALFQTDIYARAYYAVMRARTARLGGNAEKANALLRQSPLPVLGCSDAVLTPSPCEDSVPRNLR